MKFPTNPASAASRLMSSPVNQLVAPRVPTLPFYGGKPDPRLINAKIRPTGTFQSPGGAPAASGGGAGPGGSGSAAPGSGSAPPGSSVLPPSSGYTTPLGYGTLPANAQSQQQWIQQTISTPVNVQVQAGAPAGGRQQYEVGPAPGSGDYGAMVPNAQVPDGGRTQSKCMTYFVVGVALHFLLKALRKGA